MTRRLRILFAMTAMTLAAQCGIAAEVEFNRQAVAAAHAIKEGKNDEALATLNRMIKRYPNAADLDLVYWLSCKVYTAKADYDAAVASCSAAIKRNQHNVNFYADRGRALFLRGEAARAQNDLETAATMNSDKAFVHGMLARLYWDEGETAKAKAESAKALKLDPRDDNAREVVAAAHQQAMTEAAYSAVHPIPREPPAVVTASSIPPASEVRSDLDKTSPAVLPSKPAPAPRLAASAEPVQVEKSPDADRPPNIDRPKAEAAIPPQGGPLWWQNTPPVPVYGAARHVPRTETAVNCANPRATAERLICSDEALRRQDVEMDRLFHRVQLMAADEDAMEAEQREWIEIQRNACRSKSCLRARYANHRLELMLWLDE
jgi:Flp pilus assembly protein TadD